MPSRIVLTAVAAVVLATSVSTAPERPAPTVTRVAEGIYLFQTAPYGPVGLDGNAVAIVSEDGVLVFDSNGTPAAADAVIAELRRLTPQPVRYVVNSHWHWDHWYGTEAYTRAFPGVHVVTHEKTRALMAGPAIDFNRPGLETQLPGFIGMLEQRVADGRAASPPPENLARVEQDLEMSRWFLDQKRAAHLVLPDVTFAHGLTVRLGSREIQVLNYGRGVTPGDTFLYLPAERVLVTGDLLIQPITFALSSYPTEWIAVLEKLDALDAAVIVPGHGAPMHDEAHLHATMAVLRELKRQGLEARARGLDPDEARAEILPRLGELVTPLTGGDPAREQAFAVQMADWFLHRVYEEADGPLTDAIAPIPPR
ncbi:MAG: MBL fold metallo-hydrolase [Vicinamibacterales bacterium]